MVLAILVVAVLVQASAAFAQAELAQLFDPRLGRAEPRATYRGTYHPDAPVAGRAAELGSVRHDLSLLLPVRQSDRDEWTVQLRSRLDDVDTDARLPDTGERFPDELWTVEAGLGYRHRLDNGYVGGASLRVGSASDEPFASLDETIVSALTSLLIPRGPRQAWLLSLSYSNNRPFLNNVPLPGVAYLVRPSDRLRAIVGFPFANVQVELAEGLTFRAAYVFTRRVNASLTYDVTRTLAFHAAFDWDESRYLRADRDARLDGLTHLEKRAAGGVRLALGRSVSLDLSGGYAFDRIWFEGEDVDERYRNRLNVGDGPFASIQVRVEL